MRKFLTLTLAAILCLSALLVVNAAKHNPFENMFKNAVRQEQEAGKVKNIFALFDENHQQINSSFTIKYRDDAGSKEMQSNAESKVYITFDFPNYLQVMQVTIDNTTYDIVGDTYESFDRKDVLEGEVNHYVLKVDKEKNIAFIYDAD